MTIRRVCDRSMRWAWVIVVAGFLAAAVAMASPVRADPSADPCPLAVSVLCRFVPIAPELDGDVDYTKQQPGSGPLAPESARPADPCAGGCI